MSQLSCLKNSLKLLLLQKFGIIPDMDIKQISNKALKTLRILLWFGLGLVALAVLLFFSAYGTNASITRLYVVPILVGIPGLLFFIPPAIILLKIWLIQGQIKDIKEKGEKAMKVAKFADKMFTKYTNKNP